MYRTFGDLFMYRKRIPTKYAQIGFKECILLKNAVNDDEEVGTQRLTKIDIIYVYDNGRMEFKGVENDSDFFIRKEDSIKNIKDNEITFIFDIFNYDEKYEDLIEYIEDFYGGIYKDENDVLLWWFCDNYTKCDIASSKIATQFRKSISDPSYTMCKNRILKEFQILKYTFYGNCRTSRTKKNIL